MRALLLVVAAIFALNVAYAAFLVVSELVHRWRARRELGALEAMWFADRQDAGGHARRSVGRIVLAGASLLLVSGLTVVLPVGDVARNVMEHVTDAIGVNGPGGDPGVVAAPSGAHATESPALAPSVGPTTSADPSQDGRDRNEDGSGTGRTTTDRPERESSPGDSGGDAPGVEAPVEDPTPTDDPEPEPTDEPTTSPSVDPPGILITYEVRSPTVVLSWEAVRFATRYEVALFDTGEDAWTPIASLPPGKRSWTSDALEPGVSYGFRVTASLSQGGPAAGDVTVAMPPA